MKTYTELTAEEKMITYKNFEKLCREDKNIIPYDSFEEYDKEQSFLDFDFDETTLECLG